MAGAWQVTLSEALAVEERNLTEEELWAVISESANSIHDSISEGKALRDGEPAFAITPETLYLCQSGNVQFAKSGYDKITNFDFVPPELETLPPGPIPELTVEKIFVFALGITMYWAADYKLVSNQELQISELLDQLISAMCEDDPNMRLPLKRVMEICMEHQRTSPDHPPNSYVVRNLYKLLMGSSSDLESADATSPWEPKGKEQFLSTDYSRKHRQQSRSRSRSGSRSRSRNSHYSYHSPQRKRPHPIGQDHADAEPPDHTSDYSHHSRKGLHENKSFYSAIPGGILPSYIQTVPSEIQRIIYHVPDYGPQNIDTGGSHLLPPPPNWPMAMPSTTQSQPDLAITDDDMSYSSLNPLRHQVHPAYPPPPETWHMPETAQQDSELPPSMSGGNKSAPSKQPVKKQQRKAHNQKKSNVKPRPFYGPEFSQSHEIVNLRVPDSRSVPAAKMRNVDVVYLTGQKFNVLCNLETLAKDIFHCVVSHLDILESFYYGLTFTYEHVHYFIDHDTPLSKVIPKSWKGQNPDTYTLFFRVKFYSDKIENLINDMTLHLFYLQLRQDLLEDHYWCTETQAVSAASLALQAEYGDHILAGTKQWSTENYVPPKTLRKIGKALAKDLLLQKLTDYRGIGTKLAEMRFIKEVMSWPEYGIHFYQVCKNKPQTGTPLWVGIGIKGITVAENHQDGGRHVIHRFLWSMIQKVSFDKKRFGIQPKPDAHGKKVAKLNYFSDSYKKCRYLTQFCTSHHRFQMIMQTTPLHGMLQRNVAQDHSEDYAQDFENETIPSDNLSGPKFMNSRKNLNDTTLETSDYEDETYESNDEQIENDPKEAASFLPPNSDDQTINPTRRFSNDSSNRQLALPQGIGLHPDLCTSDESLDITTAEQHMIISPNSRRNHTPEGLQQPNYQLRNIVSNDPLSTSPTGSLDLDLSDVLSPNTTSIPSKGIHASGEGGDFSNTHGRRPGKSPDPSPSTNDNSMKYERDSSNTSPQYEPLTDSQYEVVLTKKKGSLGLNITGGVNTSVKFGAIYVKSLASGGPAEEDGRIRVGDRLLEINELSLNGVTHRQAVETLRSAPEVCRLVLQIPSSVDAHMTGSNDELSRSFSPSSHLDLSYHKADVSNAIIQGPTLNRSMTPTSANSESRYSAVSSPTHHVESASESEDHSYPSHNSKNSAETPSPIQNFMHDAGLSDASLDDSEEEDQTYYEEGDTIYKVTLTKGEKGLGFTVAGSHFIEGYFYVKDVLYDPAMACGKIKSGHRLLRVDHKDMTELNHRDAVAYLRQTSETVSLTFYIPTEEERANAEFKAALMKITLSRHNDSFGFSLIQGEFGMSSALFVNTVMPNGSADRDGRLCIGDRILQVNETSVIGMAHNKVVALVKNSNDTLKLTVTRSTSSTKVTTSPQELAEISVNSVNRSRHTSGRSSLDTSLTNHDDNQVQEDEPSEAGLPSSVSPHLASMSLEDNHEVKDGYRSAEEDYASESASVTSEHSLENGDDESSEHAQEEAYLSDPGSPAEDPLSFLPGDITDSWLDCLPLAQAPANTVHYTGQQLQATIRQIRGMLQNEVPIAEYKNLKHAKLTDNCLEARKQENKLKNRYRNVLPYDANRVKLSGIEDYINASHVRFTAGKESRHYIASQGPLPLTVDDFWRMVWERKVEVIAMVTKDVEDGKVKCHRYWPEEVTDSPMTVCDRYEITLTRTHHLEHFDVRCVLIEDCHTRKQHQLVHLNFLSWPDQGTPETGIPLLKFIQFAKLVCDSGLILVHCSAGIGRTGALIAIDIVLSMIEKDLKFDLQKIVQDLRRQRQGMIQTKDQYSFCYKAALQAIEWIQANP